MNHDQPSSPCCHGDGDAPAAHQHHPSHAHGQDGACHPPPTSVSGCCGHAATPPRDPGPQPPGTRWTCPMHPEVQADSPGPCPLCGMALEPMDPGVAPDDGELRDMQRRFWWGLPLTLLTLVLAMGPMLGLPLHGAWNGWLQLLAATPVVLWAGWPFFVRGAQSIISRHLNMFTLIAIGTGAAWLFSSVGLAFPAWLPAAFLEHGQAPLYFESAAVIVTLVLLGQVLELRARAQTSGAVRALLELAPPIAHRVEADGREVDIDVDAVQIGDLLRIRPGERVPVDGEVSGGASHVDEAMLTGEPDPQRKQAGDALHAGTVNGTGALLMRAQRVGRDTLLAQIVHRVAEAQRSRAPIQRLADVVAGGFVPVVLLVAIVAAVLWAWLGPPPAMAHALVVAVSVLIIACPCALGLATPMSIMVGVGRGAQAGVLIRDAAALETLERVDTLLLDKTGTLTEGRPSLRAVQAVSGDEAALLRLAAAAEASSEHPLARAIVAAAEARGLTLPEAEDFGSDPGRGAWARVDGHRVQVGNRRLLDEQALAPDATLAALAARSRDEGATAVYVVVDGTVAGLLVIADAIKASSAEALRLLRGDGLRILMLTGDDAATAAAVARELGIDEVHADVLPEGKAAVVRRLQAEGRVVAMVGDGVNDAPALALAEVGIAMGTGTDVAMESAAVTLVRGDLLGIHQALRLSRLTLRNIRQNLFFAFVYNAIGVPLAAGLLYPAFGILLSPMLASAAMSASSLCVIGNALRLRRAAL